MRLSIIALALLLLPAVRPAAQDAASAPLLVSEFRAAEAGQGVAVDDRYVYAIDSRAIGKYDKRTGQLIARWQGDADGPIVHMDGGMVLDDKLYVAHSNYPGWPMTSSLEIWNTGTLEHVGSHSFGINWGSLTWADFHGGFWWMTFANYDRPLAPGGQPYGRTATTQLIKFTADFRLLESWVLPSALLARLGDMSNSGGSWGPDNFLYLTGHDPAEVYRMRLPTAGAALDLVAVLPAPIRGQGVAWDRSNPGVLFGVVRATAQERAAGGEHKVVSFRLPLSPGGAR